jgi:hypothetical protein
VRRVLAEFTFWTPPTYTEVVTAVPPEFTFWTPPLFTLALVAVPPPSTISAPLKFTVSKREVPFEMMLIWPELTVVVVMTNPLRQMLA